ncbi:Ger(x)C family spore germination protein [Cohnella pontilimi]|nr:Ger(x)C family spore germination protein [Cohnella pontilimi]
MKAARRFAFTLLIGVFLLQTGCWSAVELNERAFARVMLIDQMEEGIELTLGFPLPNRLPSQAGGGGGGGGGNSENEPFTYVTKTSSNLADAYRQIQTDLPRRITFGQLRNIVIGRHLAENGLESFVDFMARIPNIHINANLFMTEGRVMQITKFPVLFEKFPTDILARYAKNQLTVTVTMKDLLDSLYHGGDFVVPLLVFGRQGTTEVKPDEKWMSTNGAALLRSGRLVGTLTSEESRGAMWIMGKVENTEVDVASPADGKNISFFIESAGTRIRSELSGGHIRIHITCKGDARAILSNSNINLTDPRQLRQVERALENELKERIRMTIEKVGQSRTDAFQLGRYVEWRYPRQWNSIQPEWRRRLATDVEVEPHVKIRIISFGGARKPEWNRIIPNRGATS